MFWIIRFLIGICVFLCFFCIGKAKRKIRILRASIITTVLLLAVIFFPFENCVYTFQTPNAAFAYYYTDALETDLVVEGRDTDLVIGSADDRYTYLIVPRAEDGWKVGTGANTRLIYHALTDDAAINIFRYCNSDEYYVTVLNTNGGPFDVRDVCGSDFVPLGQDNAGLNCTFYTYFAYIQDFSENYILFVNGNNVVIPKK